MAPGPATSPAQAMALGARCRLAPWSRPPGEAQLSGPARGALRRRGAGSC
jgi:hypothetical protein